MAAQVQPAAAAQVQLAAAAQVQLAAVAQGQLAAAAQGQPAAAAQDQPAPAKSFIVYDQYVLQQDNGPPQHFVDLGESVDEFKQKPGNRMVRQIGKNTTDGRMVPYLPGQRKKVTVPVATELLKDFSRSLLDLLKVLEAEGLCIENFVKDHLRVFAGGVVKLRGAQLQSKAVIGDAAYELQLEANYLVAGVILRDLCQIKATHVIPADIACLLDLIQNHFDQRDLFPNHASIKPLGLQPGLFKDLHDTLQIKVTDGEYHDVCYAISASFGATDWRIGVKQNDLLRETFFFRGGGDYNLPGNTPNQTILSNHQLKALRAVNLISQNNQWLTAAELGVVNGHLCLKYLRNRLAHRPEAIAAGDATDASGKVTGWNRQLHDFSLLHSELVVLVHFQKVLSSLQFELHQRGYPKWVSLI